jgi:hypothetical protein
MLKFLQPEITSQSFYSYLAIGLRPTWSSCLKKKIVRARYLQRIEQVHRIFQGQKKGWRRVKAMGMLA